MTESRRVTRRHTMTLLAVGAAGGALMSREAFAAGSGADAGSLMPGAEVCAITPETTEGPYYFDPSLERTDITEGRPGAPADMRLQVVDAACRPIEGARVDLWHCDAAGLYSGYPGQGDDRGTDTSGQTFMRGTQFADAEGMVRFRTVYPGWYRGRTTHMHFKVFLDRSTALTGQIFFPDAVSEDVYASPAYSRPGRRDTLNGNDGIARRAGSAAMAQVESGEEAYLVSMIIGVDAGGRGA